MENEAVEEVNPMVLIEVQLHTTKGVVFKERVADNLHNACFWMQENADKLEKLWEEHVNNEPRFVLADVANPLGYDA